MRASTFEMHPTPHATMLWQRAGTTARTLTPGRTKVKTSVTLFSILVAIVGSMLLIDPLGSFAQEPSVASPSGGQGDGRRGRPDLVKRLESPERDASQKPEEVIRILALGSNSVVADIGAGTGYFASRLARAVPEGKVYAIEIEPQMVHTLKERAASEGLANLVPIQAMPDDPKLPAAIDLAFMANVYALIPNRQAYICGLRAKLTPTGRLAVISSQPGGKSGAAWRGLESTQVRDEVERCGYTLLAEYDFLPDHFFLVFGSSK
jgi:SAM-dependent methyltransferase